MQISGVSVLTKVLGSIPAGSLEVAGSPVFSYWMTSG